MSLNPSQQGYRPSPSTSSLVTPELLAISDVPSNQHQIDASVQDYFLIELVHTLRRSSQVARDRRKKREEEMIANGLLPSTFAAGGANTSPSASRSSVGSPGTVGGTKPPVNEEEEAIKVRLEALGVHVGANLAERLSAERGRFTDTLDIIKFLCKDVWTAVWDKQIDNLRTNHRGVYVLQDNAFQPILRMSSFEGPAHALKQAKMYTAFPAGVLRGALARLGLQGVVAAEITSLPQCTFQVKLPKGT
ncbi:transport protein particle component [Ramaria rubella]|nr:transport protein particle component [Ramaria rubella]